MIYHNHHAAHGMHAATTACMQGPTPPMHAKHQQVCKREDSETYAKRTITEIETCLGFRFNRDGTPAAPEDEMINEAEIAVSMPTLLRGQLYEVPVFVGMMQFVAATWVPGDSKEKAQESSADSS